MRAALGKWAFGWVVYWAMGALLHQVTRVGRCSMHWFSGSPFHYFQ